MGEQSLTQAHLDVCRECGKHGHIVTGSGRAGAEFCAQHQGLNVLAQMAKAGSVSVEEIAEVMIEIGKTDWPLELESCDRDVVKKIDRINSERLAGIMAIIREFKKLKPGGPVH